MKRWALALAAFFCWAARAQAPVAGFFYPIPPCRLLDTRMPIGPGGGPAFTAGGQRIVSATSACGLPREASALAANITVTQTRAPGILTVFPGDLPPAETNVVAFSAGVTRAGSTVITLASDGSATFGVVNVSSDSAHVIVDVSGYFRPTVAFGPPPAPLLDPPPGVYAGARTVSLTSDPDATVRYTRDGSAPASDRGLLYTGPFLVDSSMPVRAAAYRRGFGSLATGGSYTITPDVASGGRLFLATLTPESSTVTAGSGSASLRLAADGRSAIVRASSTNLSSTLTGMHVHGPADPGTNGPILFDIDAAPVSGDGSYLWTFIPVGGVSVADIVAAINAGRTYVNVHTSRYPSGEIRGHLRASSGSGLFTPPPPPPGLPNRPPNAPEAARFLTQATFGPRLDEIATLRAIGYRAWLDRQFALPLSSHLTFLDTARAAGEPRENNRVMESFWDRAVTAPDQLRQRIAFALSEILVVSDANDTLGEAPDAMAAYLDLLDRNAFGNFRQLLEEVTLSPAMGVYLNMLANDDDPSSGRNPNENYAREVLQLFSIGLYRLHPDGTLVLGPDGAPIPTYAQETVKGFAKALTGWSYGGVPTTDDSFYYVETPDWRVPMQIFPGHHSTGAKKLLSGVELPGGQTGAKDLRDALDLILRHPNVGPFLARGLIQRLVTSNPSPGYVFRVARAFEDNGAGVRGDMKAVIAAILLDWEARSSDATGGQAYGKVREPLLRLSALLRGFGGAAPSGTYRFWNLEDPEYALAQNPLRSPTVFNFFSPAYAPGGVVAQAGVVVPELQIHTETSSLGAANFLDAAINSGIGDGADLVTLDFTRETALARSSDAALLDELNLLLLSGGMTPDLRGILASVLTEMAGADALEKVRTAVYLVVTSADFATQK